MPYKSITSEDVASFPQPVLNLAESIQFSPNDKLLTYIRLPSQSFFRQLYAYDLENDREFLYARPDIDDGTMMDDNLSEEDEFRREVGVFSFIL